MRPRLRPRRHWTVKTVSDHDAYFVEFRLPGGALVVIGTWNLSIAAVRRKPVRLKGELVRLARRCDVLLVQEAGAARNLIEDALAYLPDHRAYFGIGKPGQASTPIVYNKRRPSSIHTAAYELTGRLPLAPGAAGPPKAKPKWLNVVTVEIGGDLCNVANLHATPSTRFPLNAYAALLQFRRSAKILRKLPGLVFAGGDLNQNMIGRLVRFLLPWRRRGLRSSQRRLGPLPTHGRRAIDDVYFEADGK